MDKSPPPVIGAVVEIVIALSAFSAIALVLVAMLAVFVVNCVWSAAVIYPGTESVAAAIANVRSADKSPPPVIGAVVLIVRVDGTLPASVVA